MLCGLLLLGLAMVGQDLYLTRWDGSLSIDGHALWGRDFVNVYTAGKLTLQHRLGILYDVDAYRAYQGVLFHGGLEWHNYSYPPATLLYAWIFALLPYPLALAFWLAGTGAFFAWAAKPYLREAGLSVQKIPEQLEVLEALPRNALSKVLKAELRQQFA